MSVISAKEVQTLAFWGFLLFLKLKRYSKGSKLEHAQIDEMCVVIKVSP